MRTSAITVDREIFTVKNFSPVAQAAKIKCVKKFFTRVFNFRHQAMQRKLNTRTFLTQKKATRKFPGVRYNVQLLNQSAVTDNLVNESNLVIVDITHTLPSLVSEFQCSRVVCRLPRQLGTCTNSVHQAVFPPSPHKSLGTRLHKCMHSPMCHPTLSALETSLNVIGSEKRDHFAFSKKIFLIAHNF